MLIDLDLSAVIKDNVAVVPEDVEDTVILLLMR